MVKKIISTILLSAMFLTTGFAVSAKEPILKMETPTLEYLSGHLAAVTANISNSGSSEETVSLIAAYYDAQGKLSALSQSRTEVLAGKSAIESLVLPVQAGAGNVRLLAWQDMEQLRPVAQSEEVSLPAILSFYVAPNGDDESNGLAPELSGADGPFRTVEKARDTIRDLDTEKDIVVFLRGGTYEIGEKITFGTQDSGKNGNRIIYRAYADEQPELVGGVRITGWTDCGGGIYSAPLPEGMEFQTLMENDRQAVKARYPNSGYFETTMESPRADAEDTNLIKAPDDPVRNELYFDPNEMTETFDPVGVQAYLWSGEGEWNWFTDIRPVQAANFEENYFTLAPSRGYKIGKGSRYYLQGALAFLDEPGEFCIKDGLLYYMPYADNIENAVITAPVSERLLEICGTSGDEPVTGLEFNGITFQNSDFPDGYLVPPENDDAESARQGLVHLENAEGNRIVNCTVKHAGTNGIMLNRFAVGNEIIGNRIEEVGFNGIYLAGWFENSGPDVNRANVIENNWIARGGRLVGHGSGIQLAFSGNNRISHNQVSEFPRYGISIKGYPCEQEKYSGSNVIEYNDIFAVMQDSQDGGAIETWNAGKNNVIRANRIHDMESQIPFGTVVGIYADDESHDIIIANNLIHDMSGKGSVGIILKGNNSLLSNNMIANHGGVVDITLVNGTQTRVEKNVTHSPGGDQIYLYTGNGEHQIDNNVYYHPDGNHSIGNISPDSAFTTWQKMGFDTHSVLEDSLILDAPHRNFQLKEGSPALEKGFKNVDQTAAGLIELAQWTPRRIKQIKEGINAWDFDASSGEVIKNADAVSVSAGSSITFDSIDCGMGAPMKLSLLLKVPQESAGQIVTIKADGKTVGSAALKETQGIFEEQFVTVSGLGSVTDLTLETNGGFELKTIAEGMDLFFAPAQITAEDFTDIGNAQITEDGVITGLGTGTALVIQDFYFGEQPRPLLTFDLSVNQANAGGKIEIRRGSAQGELMGTLTVENTESWNNFVSQSVELQNTGGSDDLYLVMDKGASSGYVCNLKGMRYDSGGIKQVGVPFSAEKFDRSSGVLINGALGGCDAGDWVKFSNVDFQDGYQQFKASVSVLDELAGGTVQICLDSPTGPLIGSLVVSGTGSWTNYQEQTADLVQTSGIHDLYFVFNQTGTCGMRWFQLI